MDYAQLMEELRSCCPQEKINRLSQLTPQQSWEFQLYGLRNLSAMAEQLVHRVEDLNIEMKLKEDFLCQ